MELFSLGKCHKTVIYFNQCTICSFVSDGSDALRDAAFFVDPKIGYKKWEMEIIVKAMKKIEAETCIRFERIKNPVPGRKWLAILTEGRESACYINYIKQNLLDKEIGNLGKVFGDRPNGWDGECFGGAYASWLGSGSPTFMVASGIDLRDDESMVGLFVHELLHNLGVGHTQKRPGKLTRSCIYYQILLVTDRDNYVTVNYNNIETGSWSQYEKCVGTQCQTFGTPYDCQSIMHYRDRFFGNGKGKTMSPKNPSNCDLGGYMTQLTASDITLLKVLYA